MSDNESNLIDLALAENLISAKQAQLVRNELRMFPTQKAGASLVRHLYISEAQLAELRQRAGAGTPPPAPARPPEAVPRPAVPPVGQAPRPAPEPKIAEPVQAHVSAGVSVSSEPDHSGPVRADQSTIAVRSEPDEAASGMWSPLNAAVNAATRRGQKPGAVPPPDPTPEDAADTGTEMMSLLRRKAMARPTVEAGPSPASDPGTPQPKPAPKRPDRSAELGRLKALLVGARNEKASDFHLSPGRPPYTRAFGGIVYPDLPELTAEESEELCMSCLSPAQEEEVRRNLQIDFSFEFLGGGRYRCNVFRQRLGWEGSFRVVPDRVPSMEDLGLPDSLKRLTEYTQGMILVTGPSSSGKTTTVAAMLQHINESRPDHIITLEDPVEYVFDPRRCHITQREIGPHTRGFAHALRAALREDPDVILVGELRDVETISIAASAAETGHLVFGTLHTGSAVRSVARIIDSYPPEQREQAASMISKSVRGVVSQQLVPRKDGAGLVLALEILIFTSAVAALVRDGKTHQLQSAMQGGKRAGMRLMDESLTELMQKGIISGREAWFRAENKQPFEGMKDR